MSRQQPPAEGSREKLDVQPIILPDREDEWSSKLGHANFTIQPEPYQPKEYTPDILEKHRANWELARHNYAKHIVRTGEHYGITSITYKLTEEKWKCIDAQWKKNHEHVITGLESVNGKLLWLDGSNIHPGKTIRIPRLHDKGKFPDLGDEDIVGPMNVAPTPKASVVSQVKPLRKRNFFRFIQDLFCVAEAKA